MGLIRLRKGNRNAALACLQSQLTRVGRGKKVKPKI